MWHADVAIAVDAIGAVALCEHLGVVVGADDLALARQCHLLAEIVGKDVLLGRGRAEAHDLFD